MTAPRADMERIRQDHWRHQTTKEDALWTIRGHSTHLGTQLRQGHRTGFWQGVEYVLTLQHQAGELPVGELLTELRKGPGSIYWPLYSEDPCFWGTCPRCDRRILIQLEGICPECTYDIQEND